jgi:hypothetical protein
MVIKVYHVEGDPSWLEHEGSNKILGWICPECKVQFLWSRSWSYIGPTEEGDWICLNCGHRLGLIW